MFLYFIMLVPNKKVKCNFRIHNYTCVSYSMTTCVYYNIWNERGKHIIQHQLHLFNAFHWFKATINSDFTINLKDNSKRISLFLCLNMCVLIIYMSCKRKIGSAIHSSKLDLLSSYYENIFQELCMLHPYEILFIVSYVVSF